MNSKIDFLADKVGTLVDRLIKPAASPPSQDIMDVDTFQTPIGKGNNPPLLPKA